MINKKTQLLKKDTIFHGALFIYNSKANQLSHKYMKLFTINFIAINISCCNNPVIASELGENKYQQVKVSNFVRMNQDVTP